MSQNHDGPVIMPPALGALLSIVAQLVHELDVPDARDSLPPRSHERLRTLVEETCRSELYGLDPLDQTLLRFLHERLESFMQDFDRSA